jgi:hypothetical protein
VRGHALLAVIVVPLSLSCADQGEPQIGHADPCRLAQGPLLGCPPPSAGESSLSVEDACMKLVECNIIYLDETPDMDTEPLDDFDLIGCIARLEDNPPDRLLYSLRCIEVSTCDDLREAFDGPCFIFGRDP